MASPGQKRGTCGHVMAAFDQHSRCARCREKGQGSDHCVNKQDCKYCTIISCLRSPNAIIIPTLWLKTKEIPRLCGTVSKRFYTGPLLLFYLTTQIKPTLRTLSVSSSMTKSSR